MLSPVRPSVVCLSVKLVRPVHSRLKFSTMFLRRLIQWPSVDIEVKFYRDYPRETPPSGEGLNARGVANYDNFGTIEGYISETVQDRR